MRQSLFVVGMLALFISGSAFGQNLTQVERLRERQRKLELDDFLSNKTCQLVAYDRLGGQPVIMNLKALDSMRPKYRFLLSGRQVEISHRATHELSHKFFGPRRRGFELLIEPAIIQEDLAEVSLANVRVLSAENFEGWNSRHEPFIVQLEERSINIGEERLSFELGNYLYQVVCFVNNLD